MDMLIRKFSKHYSFNFKIFWGDLRIHDLLIQIGRKGVFRVIYLVIGQVPKKTLVQIVKDLQLYLGLHLGNRCTRKFQLGKIFSYAKLITLDERGLKFKFFKMCYYYPQNSTIYKSGRDCKKRIVLGTTNLGISANL